MGPLLLAACVRGAGQAGDSDAVGTADTGTAATDTDTATPRTDACTLVDPMVFGTVDDVEPAWYGYVPVIGLVTAEADIQAVADLVTGHFGDECPTYVLDEASGSFEIVGGCTDDFGEVWAGRLAIERDDDSYAATYEAFSLDDADGRHFEGDGSWSEEHGADAFDLAYAFRRGDAQWDGAYEIRGRITWSDEGYGGETYYRAIEPAAGPPGDACLSVRVDDVDACSGEGDGTVTLSGANVAVVTEDGGTACDGCRPVTIDGVDVGEICG